MTGSNSAGRGGLLACGCRAPELLAPLLHLVTPANIVFGSDTPWGSMTVADSVAGLAKHGFSPAELRRIERDNALAMMPSLALKYSI